MAIRYDAIEKSEMSIQIADAIREAILRGDLLVGARLPSETELADRFGVSRPTVREGLKRLAAQNLIRTRRGPTGGSFVRAISWGQAHEQLVSTSMLLVSMNPIDPGQVAEARLALESACLPMAAERRTDEDLAAMRSEVTVQRDETTGDEAFCASDVRFHRALVDAAANPFLSFQMAGSVEAMQPLLNMITYRSRDRREIAARHAALADAIEARDPVEAEAQLARLSTYVADLIQSAYATPATHDAAT